MRSSEANFRRLLHATQGIGVSRPLPLYVVRVEPESNRVVVGRDEELLSSGFTAAGVNWVAFDEPEEPFAADVRVRYRHTEAPAAITPLGGGRARVRFDDPQRAVTPGQAAVFYRGEEVVGGGWIVR